MHQSVGRPRERMEVSVSRLCKRRRYGSGSRFSLNSIQFPLIFLFRQVFGELSLTSFNKSANFARKDLTFFRFAGAFLLPYIVVLFLVGKPMYFMEIAIGQYHAKSPVPIWKRIAPIAKGIGMAQIVISSCVAIYYGMGFRNISEDLGRIWYLLSNYFYCSSRHGVLRWNYSVV